VKPKDPLVWDGIAWVGITDADRAEWTEAFPAVSLDGELMRAHLWLKANPERARKKKWRAFLTAWLGRSQEKGGGGTRGAPFGRHQARDESHIPDDVHPDDRRMFFTPDGKPRTPLAWRRRDGTPCH